MADPFPSGLGPALRPEPLRDQIYDRVRAAIISGDLPPGTALVEADLAARMGASRTPTREALRKLEAEGLVERRGSRTVVRELDLDEAVCVFEIRDALETLAVRRAARRIGEAELAVLDELVAGMYANLDDVVGFDKLAAKFHDHLLAWANGERLRRMLAEVRADVYAYRALGLRSAARRRESAAEHKAIVAALRAHDEEAVARLTSEHIMNGRDAVLNRK